MKHTVATLKQINGNTDNDNIVASEFCKEALAEVRKRADEVENVCELGVILDTKVFAELVSALAGIRHIALAVESVTEFHRNGKLGSSFNNLHVQLSEIMRSTEKNFLILHALIPNIAP